MKKFAVLLTITLMVMLVEANTASFAVEPGPAEMVGFSIDHPELSSGTYLVQNPLGGVSSNSIEVPDTAHGAFMIENDDGGAGSFSIEFLDSALAFDLLQAKYFCLLH